MCGWSRRSNGERSGREQYLKRRAENFPKVGKDQTTDSKRATDARWGMSKDTRTEHVTVTPWETNKRWHARQRRDQSPQRSPSTMHADSSGETMEAAGRQRIMFVMLKGTSALGFCTRQTRPPRTEVKYGHLWKNFRNSKYNKSTRTRAAVFNTFLVSRHTPTNY